MRRAIILLVVSIAALGAVTRARAQSNAKALTFEVASIKPNTSGDSGGGANFQPGGRFAARNVTLRGLIAGAFGDPVALAPSRMTGGPSWIDTDRFDVQARAAAEFPEV